MSTMPEGVEMIASSSSQDEADTEDSPSKFRKRRKILRRTRLKIKHKGKNDCFNFLLLYYGVLFLGKRIKRGIEAAEIEALSEPEADSEHEIKSAALKEALILPSQVNSLVEA